MLVIWPVGIALLICAMAQGQAPDWNRIRADHPRLFFNADMWPLIKARAAGPLREHLENLRKFGENPVPIGEWSAIQRPPKRPDSVVEAYDWGDRLMAAAFVQLVQPDPQRLERIRQMLWASLDYYQACFAQGKSVSWYAHSRIGWLCALDWLWNELPESERIELARSFLAHVEEAVFGQAKQRQNRGGFMSGYYGDENLALFTGLALYRSGVDDAVALRLLEQGYDTYQKVIAHRRKMADDDGGAASPTLGYAFGEYPVAEWNYLHCMKSALGWDCRAELAYVASFANYVLWNCLPGLLEYGFGDAPHTDNKLPRWDMYSHLSHIMHFYGQLRPQEAALAAHVRELFPVHFNVARWGFYPFLLTELDKAPPPLDPGRLPPARFFPQMGQLFMRSGDGPMDTYCMLSAEGASPQHKHYDSGHFTIYKQGFLALDTGTREGNTDNLQNYYAQTIAHNCILIKMPGEKPSPYWNGPVYAQAGGQDKQIGSKVIAFETNPLYSYAAIDLAPVYNAEKCQQMIRQFLFVMPDHFVVCDRVVSTKPEYAKTWLIHFANEPLLEGRVARADQDRGRIFCRTLLPEDAVIEKVGGPGKEFLVEGVNYDINAGPSENIVKQEYTGIRKLQYKEVPELMGRWRLEVKPGAPRQLDIFLHLLQVGDQSMDTMTPVRLQRESDIILLEFQAHDKYVTLRLPTQGAVGGHIKIMQGGKILKEADLTQSVLPQAGLASLP